MVLNDPVRLMLVIFWEDCDNRCHFSYYFRSLLISACIFADAVMSNHKCTQADVEKVISVYLRYAPDRKGGYRRNKEEMDDIE